MARPGKPTESLPGIESLPEVCPPAQKYLVAVSGGRDSVALLNSLVDSGYRRLVVCHLNHQLRGRDSTADARFVATLGKRYGLCVESERTDVKRLAKSERLSIETAARLARHRFFFKVAAQHRCRQLFLAHHADDQVESVLMHFFRGSGLNGLTGMRMRTTMQPPAGSFARKPITLIRPLLQTWRSEIDTYITTNQLEWREDASNTSGAHLRNRVRSSLMPELQNVFMRDVRPMVQRFAEIAGTNQHFISDLADQELRQLVNHESDQISVAKLRTLHPAIQREVLKKWLAGMGIANIGFNEIEATRQLLNSKDPAKINLPQNRHVRRKAGWLFVE